MTRPTLPRLPSDQSGRSAASRAIPHGRPALNSSCARRARPWSWSLRRGPPHRFEVSRPDGDRIETWLSRDIGDVPDGNLAEQGRSGVVRPVGETPMTAPIDLHFPDLGRGSAWGARPPSRARRSRFAGRPASMSAFIYVNSRLAAAVTATRADSGGHRRTAVTESNRLASTRSTNQSRSKSTSVSFHHRSTWPALCAPFTTTIHPTVTRHTGQRQAPHRLPT